LNTEILTGSHHPILVTLSILIAILASYTALDLARQISASDGASRRLWLAGGALVMGIGIWSMHFVGMLAFRLPIPVAYDGPVTLVSLLVAIAASALALGLAARGQMSRASWLVGGVIMGCGIAAMHYIGMMAMRMAATMRHDPLWVAISVVIAVAASLAALQLAFRLRGAQGGRALGLRLASALAMGFAIAAMHYTGMAATIFEATPMPSAAKGLDAIGLSVFVAIATLAILMTAIALLLLNPARVERLILSSHFLGRYWFVIGGLAFLLFLWLLEALLHSLLFSGDELHQAAGFINHLWTDDPNELWMRAVIAITTIGLSTIGQRVFLQARQLHRQLAATRDHLEEAVAERTRDLCESEQRVHAILDTSKDAFVATNSKGRIIDWNPAAEALFGWKTLEVIGRPIAEKLFPDGPLAQLPLPGAELQAGNGNPIHELIGRHRDGRSLPVEISLSPQEMASGVVYNILIRDIGARKVAEEALREAKRAAEQASRMKSEFLANMSHELRTPLNAIIGFTEVVRDGHAGAITPTQQDYLSEVYDSSAHLLSLINDILDLSKVEAGKMTLEPEPVDLPRLLQNSLSIVKEKAHAHGIQLELEIAEDVGEMALDERKFKQILFNLLSNAVKFTPDGGRVGIRAAIDQAWLKLGVWDTGIGIALEDQGRLFHAFQQIDGSTSRKYEGTGLGLALARDFARLHGGDITLISQPGEGSCFTLLLPVRESAPDSGQVSESSGVIITNGVGE
jgi:PAS domain S-box-containing protein